MFSLLYDSCRLIPGAFLHNNLIIALLESVIWSLLLLRFHVCRSTSATAFEIKTRPLF